MKLDSLFCDMIKKDLDAAMALLETAMYAPKIALQQVISIYNSVFRLAYKAVEAFLELAADLVKKFTEINDGKNPDSVANTICRAAFECQPIITILAQPQYASLFGGEENQKKALEEYGVFDKYVCKQGVSKLINKYSEELLNNVSDLLDQAKQKMPGYQKLNEALDRYSKFLEKNKIFDILSEISQYEQCSFEVCKWGETAANKIGDFLDKNKITRTERQESKDQAMKVLNDVMWGINKADKAFKWAYEKDDYLSAKIAKWESEISKWKTEGKIDVEKAKVYGNSKSLSELMS